MALLLAMALLLLGGLLTWAAGPDAGRIGALLVGAILAYDILLKDVPAAPAVLSACRALNLLLGIVLAPVNNSSPLPMRAYLCVAVAVYTLGITVFAGGDVKWSTARRVAAGSGLTWVGIILVAALRFLFPQEPAGTGATLWVLVLLGATGYSMSRAILTPKRKEVQAAAATSTFGMIVLEAAMVASVRGLLTSVLVMLLLIPAILSGQLLSTTPGGHRLHTND